MTRGLIVRDLIQLLGPATTGLGILFSVWGTYLLTHWYHPFDARGIVRTTVKVVLLLLKGNVAQILREAGIAARMGAINHEAKSESLVGLYLIFLGFILQGIGTVFWMADVVWSIVEKHAAMFPHPG